jgi:hypothetical protein
LYFSLNHRKIEWISFQKYPQKAMPNEPQQNQPMTTTKIALGVAGGLLLFVVGVGILQAIARFSVGGYAKDSADVAEELKNIRKKFNTGIDKTNMQCNGTCATITAKNLRQWPLTVDAPVIATCKGNRLFLKADNQWYERSEKPELEYPSWTKIQRKSGFWPMEYRLSLEFLEAEITKACQG